MKYLSFILIHDSLQPVKQTKETIYYEESPISPFSLQRNKHRVGRSEKLSQSVRLTLFAHWFVDCHDINCHRLSFALSKYSKNKIVFLLVKLVNREIMAMKDGWTFVKEIDEFIKEDINDQYEVIDELRRKCLLCSKEIKIAKSSKWNMKSHFKHSHPTEWLTKFQPFMASAAPKVKQIFKFSIVGCK